MTLAYSNLKIREELNYVTETPNYKLLYHKDKKRFFLQKNRKQASLIPTSLKRACKIMNLKEERIKEVI